MKRLKRFTVAIALSGIAIFAPSDSPLPLTGAELCAGSMLVCRLKDDWVCIIPEFELIRDDQCDGRSPGCGVVWE